MQRMNGLHLDCLTPLKARYDIYQLIRARYALCIKLLIVNKIH